MTLILVFKKRTPWILFKKTLNFLCLGIFLGIRAMFVIPTIPQLNIIEHSLANCDIYEDIIKSFLLPVSEWYIHLNPRNHSFASLNSFLIQFFYFSSFSFIQFMVASRQLLHTGYKHRSLCKGEMGPFTYCTSMLDNLFFLSSLF